jgi:hypothetical protein
MFDRSVDLYCWGYKQAGGLAGCSTILCCCGILLQFQQCFSEFRINEKGKFEKKSAEGSYVEHELTESDIKTIEQCFNTTMKLHGSPLGAPDITVSPIFIDMLSVFSSTPHEPNAVITLGGVELSLENLLTNMQYLNRSPHHIMSVSGMTSERPADIDIKKIWDGFLEKQVQLSTPLDDFEKMVQEAAAHHRAEKNTQTYQHVSVPTSSGPRNVRVTELSAQERNAPALMFGSPRPLSGLGAAAAEDD